MSVEWVRDRNREYEGGAADSATAPGYLSSGNEENTKGGGRSTTQDQLLRSQSRSQAEALAVASQAATRQRRFAWSMHSEFP